ncbi:MAG: hypothetical protein ACRDZ8_20200 [Acidimicrobiales bacterium]
MTIASAESSGSRSPERPILVGAAKVTWGVPLSLGAVAAVLVVVYFSRIMRVIQLNPDSAWAPVLVRDLGRDHRGGLVLVGTAAHFTTIWFLEVTRSLPFRGAIWDVAPGLFYLGGLALTGWACWRAAGRYPAALCIAAGLGVNATVLSTVMAEGLRGNTYVADAVGGAFLVWWVNRPDPLNGHTSRPDRRIPEWTLPAVVVIFVIVVSGTSLASDPLFLASGFLPFLFAPVALWAVRRDRPSGRFAALTTSMSIATAGLAVAVNNVMSSHGYRKRYETTGYALVSSKVAAKNLVRFGNQLRLVGNAISIPGRLTLTKASFDVMGLFLLAAVAVALVLTGGAWRRQLRARKPVISDHVGFIFMTYWVGSGLAVFAAFCLTSFAEGTSPLSRYVLPVLFALAAVAPVGAVGIGWRRLVVAAGVSLFCGITIAHLGFSLTAAENAFHPLVAQGQNVIDFLESQDVTTGYAGYFDANPLTLQSGLRVHFYPVVACRAPISSDLCPFYVNARTAWYTPRAGTRTFLLTNTTTPAYVAALPTVDLGTPAMVRRFGELTVDIYDYDVAAKLAPPCPTGVLLCPDSPVGATFVRPFAHEVGVIAPSQFSWNTIPGASNYVLAVGTKPNGTDIVHSGLLPPTIHSLGVGRLPPGVTLYASLLTLRNGMWTAQTITFTSAPG